MADTSERFINRELSWLEFNQRVLDEAADKSLPLLERLKFLAITASNLDEFFMVRVGGLQALVDKAAKRDPAGMTPREQLEAIGERTQQMVADQYKCFLRSLEPKLAGEGIWRAGAKDVNAEQLNVIERIFRDEIHPTLTPIAVTRGNEFPLLVNQTLNAIVQLADKKDEPRFAVIPFGRSAHRVLTLHTSGAYSYILFEDAVELFVQEFFEGEEIVDYGVFRITRNADMAIREDSASDLLAGMEQVLDQRKESACVRLEVSGNMGKQSLAFLKDALEVRDEDVYSVPGPLDLSAFMSMGGLPGFDHLKYEPWPPQPSPNVDPTQSMFDTIAAGEVLLYHPYESFEPVVRLIEEAADDPDVLAIKQVLYRTSSESPIIAALTRAAEKGKYVTVIIELKARFDEARNIEWAKHMEQAGAQVIYGVKGLKTHAKICLIIRREPHGVQRYMHFGTGNYNESTARIYSDVSYMTCDEQLGADATSFFNAVTGYSQPQAYRKIDAAPLTLREKFLELIEVETRQCREGGEAAITAKMNSLVDPDIIEALYRASQAGVPIRLNIRGICCLRPGVKGLSDNIEVVSIVDRFLEHARIFHFHHDGDDEVYIGSADWMTRNLDKRVELVVPVEHEPSRKRLISILELYFKDNVKSRQLTSTGSYRARKAGRRKQRRSQEMLYRQAQEAIKIAEQSKRTTFQPHTSQ